MSNENPYAERDIPTVINAVGEQTRISGTLMRKEVSEAMQRASEKYVHLADLQAYAREFITEVTGAEAGLVTNGAAAGLTLSAAACIAGTDYRIANQLPHTDGIPNKILIPVAHRNQYEVAYRVAGAKLVGVGLNDLRNGLEEVEPWEIESAISEDTVAVTYIDRPHNQLSLATVVEVAHDNDLPVIVDAAAELPPTTKLTRYIDTGADLVAFSGGKAIRGPQTTGILAGRKDLVESATLQSLPSGVAEETWENGPPSKLVKTDNLPGMPRHGIGRPMKVGKEELIGLIRALELYIEEDDEELLDDWNARAERIYDKLAESSQLEVIVMEEEDPAAVSTVQVELDGAGITAATLIQRLINENPRIYVDESRMQENTFTINPKCLSDEEADYVCERIDSYIC